MLHAPMLDRDARIEPAREQHRELLRAICAEDRVIGDICPTGFPGDEFDRNLAAFFDDGCSCAFVLFHEDRLVGMTSYLNVDDENRSLEIGRTYLPPWRRN